MHSSGASQDVCRRDHEQFQLKRLLASTSMSHFCLKKLRFEETILHVGDLQSVNNGVHSSLSRLLRSSTTLGPPRS